MGAVTIRAKPFVDKEVRTICGSYGLSMYAHGDVYHHGVMACISVAPSAHVCVCVCVCVPCVT